MYMHLHICLRKKSHCDSTVIKPDETNLYIAKMGITTFTGVSGGLVVRASDSEVGGSILTRVAMNIVFLSKTLKKYW